MHTKKGSNQMGQDKYRNENQGLEGLAEDDAPETPETSTPKDSQTPTNHEVTVAENVKVAEGG